MHARILTVQLLYPQYPLKHYLQILHLYLNDTIYQRSKKSKKNRPIIKFDQRFIDSFSTNVRKAIIKGISQNSAKIIKIHEVISIPSISPLIISSTIPGDMMYNIIAADILTARKIHNTVILNLQSKFSIFFHLLYTFILLRLFNLIS